MDENKKRGMMEEDNGNTSSMRVMCMISLIAAIAFAALTLYLDGQEEGLYIFTAFLLGAFAPKAVQKFAEKKVS